MVDTAKEENETAKRRYTLIRNLTIGGIAASILLALAVAYFIIKGITRSIAELRSTMVAMQQDNDLTKRATVYGDDEIAHATQAFNLLASNTLALAGSATGIVLLVALGVWEALRDLRGAARLAVAVAGGALVAGVLAFLPSLIHRWDVYESARARADALAQSLRGPAPSVLFGRGIGLGTNASFQLRAAVGAGGTGAESPALPGGDSAVVAVVLQTGLVGLALFALSLALAALRNPSARPLFFVFALASLTLSLSEAFPLNLLLGLLLAAPRGGPSPRGSGLPSTLYCQ